MPVEDAAGHAILLQIAKADLFNQWMFQQIRPGVQGEVLEIGSGIGNLSVFLAEHSFSLTLSDYNPHYCSLLKNKFVQFKNIKEILLLDLQHPDFQNCYRRYQEKFDCLILLNVIEHLADEAGALQNCRFLLRKGGRLIVLAPAYSWLYCKLDQVLGHCRRYTLSSLTGLLTQHQFQVREKKYFNSLGIAGWFFFGKLLGRSLIGREMVVYNKLVPLAKLLDWLLRNKAGLSVLITAEKK